MRIDTAQERIAQVLTSEFAQNRGYIDDPLFPNDVEHMSQSLGIELGLMSRRLLPLGRRLRFSFPGWIFPLGLSCRRWKRDVLQEGSEALL